MLVELSGTYAMINSGNCECTEPLQILILPQSRRLPPLQVVSNNKLVSVGGGSPTEINAPRGCAVIL